MNLRLKDIVSAAESLTLSPLLPATAVMLVTLFAWSLAQAARVEGHVSLATRAPIFAANIAVKAIADGATEREAAVFSSPTSDRPAPYRVRIRETN